MTNRCLNAEKTIAAYAIIFIHCILPSPLGVIMDCWARFAVPFFFMISGYFCYYGEKEDLQKKITNKFIRIGKIIIVSQLLAIIIQVIINKNNLAKWFAITFNIKTFLKLIIFNASSLMDSTWFLFALFYCYILMTIVNKFNLFKVAYIITPFILIIQLVLGELLSSFKIILPIPIIRNFLLIGFPFMMIGHFIHFNEAKIISKLTNKLIVYLILFLGLTVVIERYLTAKNELYVSSVFTACLMLIFAIKNKDVRISPIIVDIGGRYSLGIYILHPMLIMVMNSLEYHLKIDNIAYLYIKPIFVCILSTLLLFLLYVIKVKVYYTMQQLKSYKSTND